MPIRLTEPHPTATGRMTYGRGGAGNRTCPPPSSLTSTTTRLTSSSPLHSTHKPFSTGRGGSGNIHPASDERPMFRFDEELERERVKGEQAPVYHVGRGGQGNAVYGGRRDSHGSGSESDSSRGSGEGVGSVRGSVEWVRGVVRKL